MRLDHRVGFDRGHEPRITIPNAFLECGIFFKRALPLLLKAIFLVR